MSAFHAFDETLSQHLPEMENFANQIEQQTIIERPTACYPQQQQYGYQNYFGSYQQHQQDSFYAYQYNQYSSYQPYSYSPQQPSPITIIIPKCDDQRVIKFEINVGAGTSQINVIQSIVEDQIKEPENLSYQAITELLEPSDYSTVYDSGQNTVYTEMNNVNYQELLAIEENPILQNLEIPKSVKVAAKKFKTPNKVRSIGGTLF